MAKSNGTLIDKVVEITVARVSNTNLPIDKTGGENIAEFMQAIYDKLVELNQED